jgi:hypothetical protein
MARECSGSLRRPLLVNLPHDLIGVLHSIGNRADRCWNFLGAWVLRQLAGRKNRSSNQQNALAAFIHERGIFRFRFLFVYAVLFLGNFNGLAGWLRASIA